MTSSTKLRNNYATIEEHVLNWRRWALSKIGVYPVPSVCITQKVCEQLSNKRSETQAVDIIEAEKFEGVVQTMRRQEKTAFCFYALGFAAIDGKIKIARNISVAARHLKISKSHAYNITNRAVLYVAEKLGVKIDEKQQN